MATYSNVNWLKRRRQRFFFILVTNRCASGLRVSYFDALDISVFSTASAELLWCVNKLKRWTVPTMRGPPRYLSGIAEVRSDSKQAVITENLWPGSFPVETRSLSSKPLSVSPNNCYYRGCGHDVRLLPALPRLSVSHRHLIDNRRSNSDRVTALLQYVHTGVWDLRVKWTAKQLFPPLFLSASNTQTQALRCALSECSDSVLSPGFVGCCSSRLFCFGNHCMFKPSHLQFAGSGASELTSYFYS